jgi:hypothetical protein
VYPKSAAKSIHYNLKGLDDLETLQWVGGWVWVFESLQTDVQSWWEASGIKLHVVLESK